MVEEPRNKKDQRHREKPGTKGGLRVILVYFANDEVNISYTSLLIGLLWSDDAASRWLQNQQSQLGVRLEAIYGHRGISEKERERILGKVSSGKRASPRKEQLSRSARTVLGDAGSIAQENSS